MRNLKTIVVISGLIGITVFPTSPSLAQMPGMPMPATQSTADIKISDPTAVALIVNRDSNDIAFLDLATEEVVARTFLGNNVNPHMAMMSPDGRYVVTGGSNSNTSYIIDVPTATLARSVPVGIAPEHLAFSPDGRYLYQGNPNGDSITVIDMQALRPIRTIEGLAEPLNVTFTPDGQKAYVGNYGAHWIGVIDVTRHELLKRIQVGRPPEIAQLDPARYLGEIQGVSNATITPDGRYLYAADSDLGIVGVIDTRDDRVIDTIRVGQSPWRAYMSHDGRYAITVNNGDETISIIDTATNTVAATLEAGPDMTGVNFAAGKAFVISATNGIIYSYDMQSLTPAGQIRIGTDLQNLQLETATTDTADEKLYLAVSTDHSIYVVDARTNDFHRIPNVGLYPWGTHIMDSKDNYCH